MSFYWKKLITLADVLENISLFTEEDEKGTMKSGTSISITPPDELDNDLSEQDSADGDCIEFDISRLRTKLLPAEAEVSQFNAALKV